MSDSEAKKQESKPTPESQQTEAPISRPAESELVQNDRSDKKCTARRSQ